MTSPSDDQFATLMREIHRLEETLSRLRCQAQDLLVAQWATGRAAKSRTAA